MTPFAERQNIHQLAENPALHIIIGIITALTGLIWALYSLQRPPKNASSAP